MKIYLAARYSRLAEMQRHRFELETLGFQVTARWVEGKHELDASLSPQARKAEQARLAEEDLADISSVDCVISFTEPPNSKHGRGGRHVEYGIALALGKRMIVVGYRENVFHYLSQVEFFENWVEALIAL